jgi:drug/metabolite transporter (DMT)-like permease
VIYKLGVALCVLFTVYGQIAAKIAMSRMGPLPPDWPGRFHFLLRVLGDPLVLSSLLAGLLAAMSWFIALSGIKLSVAYPYTSLNFVLVLLVSVALFREPLTVPRVIGVFFIVAGVVIGSRFGQ